MDVRLIASLDVQLLALGGKHVDAGRMKGGHAAHALFILVVAPALDDLRPEQRAKKEGGRNLLADGDALVGALQGEHQELLAVRLGDDHVQQRQKRLVKSLLTQLREAGHGMTAGQKLEYLVDKTGGGHVFEKLRHFGNRRFSGGLDREAELRRDALGWITDHAKALCGEIFKAAVIVEELLRLGIVVQRIDREVAPGRVLPHLAEDVVGDDATRGVLALARALERTEGRALDDLAPENHMYELEATADDHGAALAALHLFGRRIGRHVEVLGRDAEHQVANGTAHDVGLEAATLERLAGRPRLSRHQGRIDAVLICGNHAGILDDNGTGGEHVPHPVDNTAKHLRPVLFENIHDSPTSAGGFRPKHAVRIDGERLAAFGGKGQHRQIVDRVAVGLQPEAVISSAQTLQKLPEEHQLALAVRVGPCNSARELSEGVLFRSSRHKMPDAEERRNRTRHEGMRA